MRKEWRENALRLHSSILMPDLDPQIGLGKTCLDKAKPNLALGSVQMTSGFLSSHQSGAEEHVVHDYAVFVLASSY